MRRFVLVLLLLAVPVSLFAQDDGWRGSRRDRYRYLEDDTFDVTPFVGYTWGGTVYAGQTSLFNHNADVASSANYGLNVDIPIQRNGVKLELMVDRQSSDFTNGSRGLFNPDNRLGNLDITYYHAGILLPFTRSRGATPYLIGSAGVSTLDPRSRDLTTSTRFSASVGIGVKVPIQSHAGFRGEIRSLWISLPNDQTCQSCRYAYNRDLYQAQANLGMYFKF